MWIINLWLVPTDEDRLTRRKSFVDTISLQVDIMSNNLPEKVRDEARRHLFPQEVSVFSLLFYFEERKYLCWFGSQS